jgi:hypothetical protein
MPFHHSLGPFGPVVSEEIIPPFKMAAVAKNRNFYNCPLLL